MSNRQRYWTPTTNDIAIESIISNLKKYWRLDKESAVVSRALTEAEKNIQKEVEE
jgi:hypothetical protein